MKNLLLLSAFLFSLATTSFASSQPVFVGDWEKLGTMKVNYALDKDVLKVGVRDGRFSKLKLVVTGGSLNMHRMVVVYKNGERDEINLKHQFSRNSGSRVVDLNGNKRFIKEIIFWYDSKNVSRNKAKVSVLGRR